MKDMTLTQQHIKKYPEKLSRFTQVNIWSKQWQLWWRDNGAGYTPNRREAGIYDIQDAWKHVSHCGPEKGIILYEIIDL